MCCPGANSGDEPRHSLHASTYYREYNEDLNIIYLFHERNNGLQASYAIAGKNVVPRDPIKFSTLLLFLFIGGKPVHELKNYLKVAKVRIGLGLEVLRSPGIYANLLGVFLVLPVTLQ